MGKSSWEKRINVEQSSKTCECMVHPGSDEPCRMVDVWRAQVAPCGMRPHHGRLFVLDPGVQTVSQGRWKSAEDVKPPFLLPSMKCTCRKSRKTPLTRFVGWREGLRQGHGHRKGGERRG